MTVVDDIKSRLDIMEVISGYATLQRSGNSYKANCPFHQERTPSFYVNPDRQSWHCFGGCATGGDVFTFIMKAENLEFAEALQRLAQQAGVTLPSRERRTELDVAYRINEAARDYFQQYLASSMGADTRTYLERRGIARESVAKFQLGLSPPGRAGAVQSPAAAGVHAGTVGAGRGGASEPERGVSGRLSGPADDSHS